MKKYWIMGMAMAALLSSCSKNDDLKRDIEDLDARVTALEAWSQDLNKNIEAIQKLSEKMITISKVTPSTDNKKVTLELSDGSILELAIKTKEIGVVPQLDINDKNNWKISYDGGHTYEEFHDKAGKPVLARGENGKTPKFRVNTQGFWEVTTDGKNYVPVLDSNNKPVNVRGENAGTAQSDFFKSVKEENGYLVITLKDGNKTIKVPIVPDFFCYFEKNITGLQVIAPGTQQTFTLHIKGNAAAPFIVAPDGWKAVLGKIDTAKNTATLTVTAPAKKATTRAVADNSKDVSVLISSKNGLAAIAKIEVGTEAAPATTTPAQPQAAVINIPIPNPFSPVDAGGFSSTVSGNKVANFTTSQWYFRNTSGNNLTHGYSTSEQAISLQQGDKKGSWNNSSVGYHLQQQFETTYYKLSFQVKADKESSVGVCLRIANDQIGIAMVDNKKATLSRNVTTPKATTDWTKQELYFDFSKGSNKTSSTNKTYDEGATTLTAENLKALNILLYNNKENTTIFIKDIKLEKIK